MPNDTPRDDPTRDEDTLDRLLDAALHVIGEVGLENMTMRKVGEHAGVSISVVHEHFDDRAQLVYRTFEYLVRRMRATITAGRRHMANPVSRLKFTADMGFSEEVVSAGAANVWPYMWSSSAHDPQVKRLCTAFSRRMKSNFIFDLQCMGLSRTMANLHAIQFLALVHGLWIEYKVADTLTLEQVLVFFHATIDNAAGKLWQETIAMMEQA